MKAAKPERLAVYVHWPFCLSKCPYCDFNSHVATADVDQERFARALRAELDHMARLMPDAVVGSVFFGGGTPSLMRPDVVAAVIAHIDALWGLAADVEITLEANPTSVEAEKFASLRAAGVNRVSLGVQALSDAALKKLGRTHSAREARAALDIARRHFARFSFDLIYARPGQSLAQWQQELTQALALAGGHLSLYQLTIEPGTAYARWHQAGRLRLPDDDMAADFYALTGQLCAQAGLPAYEISNHAWPGEECRHNLIYWGYGAYVGVGPGAHGRPLVDGRRLATQTRRDPATWLRRVEEQGHGLAACDVLSPQAQIEERLLMGLRLARGIDLAPLARLGWRPPVAEIASLEADGLLIYAPSESRLQVTPSGRLVLNAIIAALLSGEEGQCREGAHGVV